MSSQSARPCIEQWIRTHGPEFAIRSCDIDWNFNSQKLVKYSVELYAGVPVIAAEATEAGVSMGISNKTLWLSLWGEVTPGNEQKLIDEFRRQAQQKGKTRISFGGDEFHFVPGVPLLSQAGKRLVQAVKSAGFVGDEVVDYNGSLQSPQVKNYVEEATQIAKMKEFRLDPPEVREEVEALGTFLQREFPGRWAREFEFWRAQGDMRRAWWMGLTQENSPDILGFARVAVRGREPVLDSGWTPAALRLPVFEASDRNPHWSAADSCLGPIGIAKNLRGQGAGKVLLGRVLATLIAHSARTVCIDWTNAFQYYEPLGLAEVRRYRAAYLDL
jgi:hypothetical protein